MKAALVIMSVLGCNDAGTQCQPVASVSQEWQTIAACDAASEKVLNQYKNVHFPAVVAVCRTANTTALMDSVESATENVPTAVPVPPVVHKDDKQGLAARAIALVRHAIPTKKDIRSTLAMPVHFVSDTYSRVARKLVH